jgi:hypothetical protein
MPATVFTITVGAAGPGPAALARFANAERANVESAHKLIFLYFIFTTFLQIN